LTFLLSIFKEINLVALKRAVLLSAAVDLTSKTIQGSALSLQGIHHIHSGNGLPLSMFRISDSISNHIFQEHLQNSSGFFVNQSGDTLNTSSSGQPTDSWLRDTLDIIPKNFSVTLGSSFAQTFSTFTTSSHADTCEESEVTTAELLEPLLVLLTDTYPRNGKIFILSSQTLQAPSLDERPAT